MKYKKHTKLTHTGTLFDLSAPRAQDVHLRDIAHSLSMQCRFNGHTREFYSVAQHCVLMAGLVPPPSRLAALFHDAAEAYTGDILSPLKSLFPKYQEIEAAIINKIFEKFGIKLTQKIVAEIKEMDGRLLDTEMEQLMGAYRTGRVLPITIEPWTPEMARANFMGCAQVLLPDGKPEA